MDQIESTRRLNLGKEDVLKVLNQKAGIDTLWNFSFLHNPVSKVVVVSIPSQRPEGSTSSWLPNLEALEALYKLDAYHFQRNNNGVGANFDEVYVLPEDWFLPNAETSEYTKTYPGKEATGVAADVNDAIKSVQAAGTQEYSTTYPGDKE